MEIEFYKEITGEILEGTNDWFFVMNDEVYRNNGETCESQAAVVGFDDFIIKCPDIGWRVIRGE